MSGSATIVSAYSWPTALSFGSPHVEVFALNQQLQPLWKYRNTTTTWYPQSESLQQLGGTAAPYTQGIAAITRGEDNVHLFRAGSLNASLFYKSHSKENYTWSPTDVNWDSQGGILSTAPSAVSRSSDRFDVFALGAGPRYQLFQISWNAATGWSDWFGLSDGSWQILPPTVVTWGGDRLDVFVLNTGNALQHTYWDGGSSWLPSGSFNDLGGFCTSRPTAVSRVSGVIDVFVRGGNSGLWQLSYSQEEWGEWVAVDPEMSIQSDPEAVSCGSDKIEVFAWASNSSLLYKKWETSDGNGTWTPNTGFQVLGDGLTGPPKAVCDGQDSLHVFVYLDNRRVGHLAWNDSAGSWSPSTGFEIIGTM